MRSSRSLRRIAPRSLPALLGALSFLLAGCTPPVAYHRPTSIRQGGFRLTNPLLDYDIGGDFRELRPFKHTLTRLVEDKLKAKEAAHISLYFRDLNNGPWFGINEKEPFSPASLLKVPVLIACLKQAEADPGLLSRKVTIGPDNRPSVEQNIAPTVKVEAGREYSVDELLGIMTTYSDNTAADLVVQNIDAKTLENTFVDLGIAIPDVRVPDDFMSVKEYAGFFRILFNASYLNRAMSEKALDYLTRSGLKTGLVAGVPASVTVARKFGERGFSGSSVRQFHDCGIVYYPRRPYLLCVMTRGTDLAKLQNTVREISRAVYKEVDRQYSSHPPTGE